MKLRTQLVAVASRLIVGVCACGLAAAPVRAQAPDAQGRPVNGPVRAGVEGDLGPGQDVVLSIASTEAYDSNLVAETGSVSQTVFQNSGFYTAMSPILRYLARGRRIHFVAVGGSNLRYYGDLHQATIVNHFGSAGFTAQVTPHTQLMVNEAATYSPSYLAGLFAAPKPAAGTLLTPTADYAASSVRSYALATSIELTHQLTPRNILTFESGYRRTNFTRETFGFQNFQSYDVGGQYGYRVSRNGTVQVGYTYRKAIYATQQPVQHNLDTSFQYQLPWSRTRSTTIRVDLGATLINGVARDAISGLMTSRYEATGEATVAHQIGQTWRLNGDYRRGVGFIAGFGGPVSTNAVSVGTDGFLSRSIDALLSASYTNGDLALARKGSAFSTYAGDARLRFFVTRAWATYVEYVCYFYNFTQGLELPPGLSPRLRRNGVRIGLMLDVPLK